MNSIKRWMMVASGIVFCLTLSISVAQAQQPFEFTLCSSGTITPLTLTKEGSFFGVERKGIAMSNHPNKAFDNYTIHLVGVGRMEIDKVIGYGYFKLMAPDEDYIIAEISGTTEETAIKFLQGTGKWKGITGGGKGSTITTGKAITPYTVQGCSRFTGTFELKK